MYVKLPSIDPYPHQLRMFKAVSEGKHILAIVHRRAGKDIVCLQMWVLRALQRVGTHVYLFPLLQQARSVIWSGMDFDGKPFLSNIPECLIEYKNDARMEIRLINGSRLVLAGSNNLTGLIGTNPVTIIYSEFALHNPNARQYLNPIIVQNKGLEIIQSTPRGKNHLWELYETVKDNPKYHIEHLGIDKTTKADGSPIITQEDIEDIKRRGMSDEMIAQEFFCDFTTGNQGAYFTREMHDMDIEGRILPIQANPNIPLHSAWDLGGTDATAGWLFQVEGNYINLLALLHDTGHGLKYFLEWATKLKDQWGCQWGNHFGPHDIAQKHQGWEQAESRLMQARKSGWFFQITPKLSLEDGIEALRFMLPKVRINTTNCNLGIRALREYQREYDEANACFATKPLHNWASHIVDALRYLSINYRRLYSMPQEPVKYSVDW
jgi:phage terminase large subunit